MSTALAPRTSGEALLPHTYEAAKIALANCTEVDECQEWADKAAALASYARQRDDDSLFQYAKRIQGRAVRRCGELLKQFDGRPENARKQTVGDRPLFATPPSQRQAAADAGMSEHQQKAAVRVANIPEETFNAAIESPSPPSITRLAEMGKRVLESPKPAGFNEAIHTLGAMRRFVEKIREHRPELIAGAIDAGEAVECMEMISFIDAWTDRFVHNLKG